jgi:folate-binding Fe-S cluster repair protein YgfZ
MAPTTFPNNMSSSALDWGQVRVEFAALVRGCGIYHFDNRAHIALTGADRTRWLNGMVTNNIRDLAVGRGAYAFLLNPQGHILGDLYAYNRGDSLLVDTERAQCEKVLQVFDKYIIMDDVEVANVSDSMAAVGLAGPQSRKVLSAVGIEPPPLEKLQFADVTWRDSSLTVVRGDNEGVDSFELWLEPVNVTGLREALLKASSKPANSGALELLRIASGIPRYGPRALNFSKGCYIGQEIVERIRSRGAVHRKFTGFHVNGALPAPGTKIQTDGKEVGEITSSATLPTAKAEIAVALGYVRREMAAPGKPLAAGDAQLSVADLPFTEVFKV